MKMDIKQKVEVKNYLLERGEKSVQQEILDGLTAKQRNISPKFFYDDKGSILFEDITHLEEYYPTNCEKEILQNIVSNINVDFNDLDIIELGSGDASKITTILNQIPNETLETINYYPVDISQSAIENSIDDINTSFELNDIQGIVADFFHDFNYFPKRDKRLFCFLGSTLGNFTNEQVETFMKELGKVMQPGDSLLLGVDMVKDINVLEAAYNDKKGVTAEFNINILNNINKHIGSDFNTKDFEHYAFYNKAQQRIEMHLRAIKDVEIKMAYNNSIINLKKDETIHTENSCKFTLPQLKNIGELAGMKIKEKFTDSKEWFSLVHYFKS